MVHVRAEITKEHAPEVSAAHAWKYVGPGTPSLTSPSPGSLASVPGADGAAFEVRSRVDPTLA